MINRVACTALSAFLSMICACAWSSEQEEVLEAFELAGTTMDEGNWEDSMGLVSISTVNFLDSLLSEFSQRGLRGYGTPSALLEVMCQEYIDFNGEVTMIFVQGETAEITVSRSGENSASREGSGKFLMVLEDGNWKLDLTGEFRGALKESLRGSYVEH